MEGAEVYGRWWWKWRKVEEMVWEEEEGQRRRRRKTTSFPLNFECDEVGPLYVFI